MTNREPDIFEKKILDELQSLLELHYDSTDSTLWTNWTYEKMNTLCESLGFVAYNQLKSVEKHGEWLWDIVWSIEGHDWKDFKGLKLISEVEWWGNDNILEDFHKLIVGVSEYRIFITEFYSESLKSWENILEMCVHATEGTIAHNFKYLVIGLPYEEDDGKELKYKAWTH